MHRGEIYLVDLSNHVGSEQSGVRPSIIVQNDVGNEHSPTTIICPMTTQSKVSIPTHEVVTPSDCGILKTSVVLCEQIRVIDKSRLVKKLGEIKNQEILNNINRKIMISVGIGDDNL